MITTEVPLWKWKWRRSILERLMVQNSLIQLPSFSFASSYDGHFWLGEKGEEMDFQKKNALPSDSHLVVYQIVLQDVLPDAAAKGFYTCNKFVFYQDGFGVIQVICELLFFSTLFLETDENCACICILKCPQEELSSLLHKERGFNMKERHKWKLWTQVLLDINHACQIMSY